MSTTPLSQDELKALVGQAALRYVVPGEVVGVGTGSTVNKFIDALATIKDKIPGAVSSSVASTERLRQHGIAVLEAEAVELVIEEVVEKPKAKKKPVNPEIELDAE